MSEKSLNDLMAAFRRYAESGSEEGFSEMHLCGAGAVAELEEKLKNHFGMRYALCVSNATTGTLAIALALHLRRTEFVTTPFTYGASVASWLQLGNKPNLADIDPNTLTLDPSSVEKAITPKTRAILSVDIFGNPVDQAALRKIADNHGIWFISDAAQSLGAFHNSVPASALADALVVSFTVGKTVFAGEGGAIITNNAQLYEKLLWFTQHPARQRRELGLHLDNEFGINGRIHPLAAIWANSIFEESLRRLRLHQEYCFDLIDVLNASGLTETIGFKETRIRPTFFRLSAAWKDGPRESELLTALANAGISALVDRLPVRLLYHQPAFITQYQSQLKLPSQCLEAERQIRSRFCVHSL